MIDFWRLTVICDSSEPSTNEYHRKSASCDSALTRLSIIILELFNRSAAWLDQRYETDTGVTRIISPAVNYAIDRPHEHEIQHRACATRRIRQIGRRAAVFPSLDYENGKLLSWNVKTSPWLVNTKHLHSQQADFICAKCACSMLSRLNATGVIFRPIIRQLK